MYSTPNSNLAPITAHNNICIIINMKRHQRNGKSFVPVQWSDTLKEGAQIWANKLARDCSLSHDPNTNHGENVALNYGWGSFSEKRPTENILGRKLCNRART